MKSYANYNYYINSYCGNMPKSEFEKLSILATLKIKSNTFNRINIDNVQEEVKFCVCVLADKLRNMQKHEGKTAERVADWSINFTNSEENNKVIIQCLKDCLSDVCDSNGTPLLYRGC